MKYFFGFLALLNLICLIISIYEHSSLEILGWISGFTGWGSVTVLKFREDSE